MSKKYPDNATYNKLVRDLIPEFVESQGLGTETRILNKEELVIELKKKVMEEGVELQDAVGDEIVGEIADVLEVLRSLAEESGIEWDDVIDKMKEKANKKGRFQKGIFMIRTFKK